MILCSAGASAATETRRSEGLQGEGGTEETRRTAGKSGPGKCGVGRVSSDIVLNFLSSGGFSSGFLEVGFGIWRSDPSVPLAISRLNENQTDTKLIFQLINMINLEDQKMDGKRGHEREIKGEERGKSLSFSSQTTL